MEILEKLKEQGWYLTEEGLKKLPDNSDVKKIIAAALDFDFREIAGGALPPELSKKDESFPGRIVLQVQKIRNISAPKANEESKAAPRFLQVELSDGVTLMQALELEHISILSLNTPPGTKIYFKCEKVPLMQGMIIMRASDVQLLGGKVTALVEKWEMTRSLQKYAKSGRIQSGSSGPPPWIPFGQKLQQTITTDKNFKSFAQTEKEKEAKENDEFNAMRSEAIAEAAKIGGKKIFGGGNHQILDHNVKKILEKGYTEEEAKNALRATGNSLERALYNLKRRGDDFKARDDFKERSKTLPSGGKRGSKDIGKRGKDAEIAVPAKPAGNVSLFDFLTDKLPANAESSASTTTSATPSYSAQNTKYENYSRPMTKAGSEPSTKPLYNSSSNSRSSQNYQDRRQNQESSSSGKSQDQNSNRPKFENNLSSSFATRNSSHSGEDRYNRFSSSTRGRGGGNPFHGRPNQPYEESSERYRDQRGSGAYSSTRGGRGGHDRGSSNNNYNSGGGSGSAGAGGGVGYDNRRYNDGQHRQDRQENQQNQRNGYEQKPVNGKGGGSSSRYQQQKDSSSNYHQNSGSNARNYDNNRQSNYNSSATTSNNNANAPSNSSANTNTTNNNADHTARMAKLVESTSKMKIDKTRSGPSPRNQQQFQQPPPQSLPQSASAQQQQQTQQQPSKPTQQQPPQMSSITTQKLQQTFGTLPNGINYDPSKIIGFQSKETNEFALNLLKSQGIPTGLPSHGGGSQATPPAASQPQFVSGPPPPQPHQAAQPPPNMQMAPQPFAGATFMVPQPVPPPTYSPNAFGMIPGENWNWKIGDQCLAKYWDDGRYYEAEITGISDKTCVVLFLGYGNHEEVLKTDCLPITDANHRPINFSNNMQQAPPVTAVAPQSMLSRGVPNRYRGERQMYVPPPKRDN